MTHIDQSNSKEKGNVTKTKQVLYIKFYIVQNIFFLYGYGRTRPANPHICYQNKKVYLRTAQDSGRCSAAN